MSFTQEIGDPEEEEPPNPVGEKPGGTYGNGLFVFKQVELCERCLSIIYILILSNIIQFDL